ncbi:MAG: hypothetical protein AB7K86_21175 [Rhodospirillales bacterium]
MRALAAAAAALVLAAAPAAAADNPCFDVAKMAQHVKDSGLAWERRGEDLWRVDLESDTRRFIRVVTSCGTNVVIVFAILADAKDLKGSEALYLYLLRMASRFDHVKIAVDPDGDYLARIDLRARTFDARDLEAAAKQLRAVVDSLTPGLRAHAN